MIGLSVVQNLQVDQIGKKALREAYIAQQPVKLTFRVVDQFGKPAVNYRFKVALMSVRWFYWLYPRWADKLTECSITTDDQGLGHLNWHIRRAWNMHFSENVVNCKDTEKYVFPYPRLQGHGWREAKTFEDDPNASFPVPQLKDGCQEMVMHVLRYDWPAKTIAYHPEVPGRGAIGMRSPGIEAQDEMAFTVDVAGNKFLEGRQAGDILITVKNAKTACEMFTKIYTPNLDFKEEGEWDVSFEALNGAAIQRAESHQIITFAPETGYKKRLNYRMAIKEEMSKSESDESHSSGGELFKLVRSAPDEEDYASIGPQGACGAHLYLRHDNPRWYGFVLIGLGPMYREGRLSINADGAYNPDGSTNLWTGHPYSPAGY
jgi:hypothetical protein